MLSRAGMGKVLIVGSGLTGAVTAALLHRELPDNTAIVLWDKARGAGGRMSTSRNPCDPNCTVDLGAQYISAQCDDYKHHHEIYKELERSNLLQPMTGIVEGDDRHDPATRHFVATSGVSSLVKHFVSSSGASVEYGRQVSQIDQVGEQWQVATSDGHQDNCDCLVVTIPTPQTLALEGDIKSLIDSQEDVRTKLAAVSYSSRFALGLFYPPGTSIDVPWCAKYVIDDPVIRFIAIDTKKRGRDSAEIGPSVAVHASVPFSLQHLEETKEEVCSEYLLPHLQRLLPNLPSPSATKPHKWRYSQVHHGYEGSPGAVVLHTKPLMILAGDAFTRSRFDGCVHSARTVVDMIKQNSKL